MKQALLVDDSKSARIIIGRLLQKHGLEVLTAESGEEAMKIIETNTPDVVFMDYMMPGMNGIETMLKIHAQPKTAGVPVVICTGNEGEGYFEEAVSHGASSLLSKPPSPEGIQKALNEITHVLKQRGSAPAKPAAKAKSAAVAGLDPAVQQAMDALRAEFEQKLAALRKEMAAGGGGAPADLEARFKATHQEIENAKKAVFDALVKRMQTQQSKLIENIKALLAKQRGDTINLIKKATGRG